MATKEAAEIIVEEGCNRGVLSGLKRAWPPSVGCSHGRTEASEEAIDTVEKEVGTADAIEREAADGWDKESITEGRGSVLIYLGLWYQVENNRMT